MRTLFVPRQAAPPEPAVREESTVRRRDLDYLRIVVCLGVILLHATIIFSADPLYHIKSKVPSASADVVMEFLRISTMPIFFVIAGWAAVGSVRKRGALRFSYERITRLLVPLVFGVFTLCPIIKYIEMRAGRELTFHGLRIIAPLGYNYFEFLYYYYTRSVLVTWSHLWFLAYLLVISFVLLPLLLRLSRCAPRHEVPLAPVVYLPGLVLAGWLVAFNGYWPYMPTLITDLPNLSYYALCFVIGAGIAVWPGVENRIRLEAPRLSLLASMTFVGVIAVGQSTTGRFLVGVTAWAAVASALGFAARLKLKRSPALDYLSRATMPVYVVHHPLLLIIASAMLPLDLAVWSKITVIVVATVAASLLIYQWLIRPWPLIGWLTGMGWSRAGQAVLFARPGVKTLWPLWGSRGRMDKM